MRSFVFVGDGIASQGYLLADYWGQSFVVAEVAGGTTEAEEHT